MTLFWIITAAMLVLALAFIAPALLRPVIRNTSTGDTENAEIARERLQQLQQSHSNGELTDAEFAQGETEIESILAEELATQQRTDLQDNPYAKPVLAVIALLLTMMTIGTYNMIGSPQALQPATVVQQQAPAAQPSAPAEMPSLPELVEQLAERMQQEPENADGWFMLGRSQMTLGSYTDAVASFRRVDELVPNAAPVLLALANATAMEQGGMLAGEPEALVLRALELEPNDPIGLWLAGNAREEANDYQAAIDYWQQAIPLLNESPADQQELIARMQGLASSAGIQLDAPPVAVAAKTLKVKVSIDPAIKAGLSGDETLFVFARAVSGPPMPIAASRHRVADMPIEVELNDAMAMLPAMKLSGFDEVQVSAKISASGSATPDENDLVSDTVIAQPGQSETVVLSVNKQR